MATAELTAEAWLHPAFCWLIPAATNLKAIPFLVYKYRIESLVSFDGATETAFSCQQLRGFSRCLVFERFQRVISAARASEALHRHRSDGAEAATS